LSSFLEDFTVAEGVGTATVSDPPVIQREPLAPDEGPRPIAVPTGALRLVSAGVEASIERFSDPKLTAEGKINLISLEAVERKLESRWVSRKDQVYDFAERVLERGVGGNGFFLRVSPTDFFIVHPDLSRLAGQAACLRYLREILIHFLGDASMAAAGVLQITKIEKGRLQANQVDADQVRAVNEALDELHPQGAYALSRQEPAAQSVNKWTPFVSNDGRELRVSATLEPVYEIKSLTRIGFRMMRRVTMTSSNEVLPAHQLTKLSAADLLRIDMATITRGIDRLRTEGGSERQLSLIVPLSFSSLASHRGRAELVTPLKAAGALVKLGVICEICDIEGVPPGALLAAASLVRPFSLLVVGHLSTPTSGVVGSLAGAGLQALSFECPHGLGDAEFIGWAGAAIQAAKRTVKSVMVYGAGTAKRAGALASLGASHVSGLS
jgi:hypothetical protein